MLSESTLRTKLNIQLEQIAIGLNLKDKDILEVGIAGDDKPSGSYRFFGEGNTWTTADVEPRWNPDVLCDISNCPQILDNSYDLVIMTQALEHIWDYKKAMENLCRITRKYLIIDCPWMFPFHHDNVRPAIDWRDWDDYWRFSPSAMHRLLGEVGFKKIKIITDNEFTLCLAEK